MGLTESERLRERTKHAGRQGRDFTVRTIPLLFGSIPFSLFSLSYHFHSTRRATQPLSLSRLFISLLNFLLVSDPQNLHRIRETCRDILEPFTPTSGFTEVPYATLSLTSGVQHPISGVSREVNEDESQLPFEQAGVPSTCNVTSSSRQRSSPSFFHARHEVAGER